jgi:uncharacterized membrane protein YqjE
MAEPTEPGANPPPDAGVVEYLRAFLASASSYLEARVQLAGIESKEAFSHYLRVLALAGIALAGVLFGYTLLCISIALILARLGGVQVMWVILALAGAHFLVALICGYLVANRVSAPMFRSTLSEFRKDREWLNNPRPR